MSEASKMKTIKVSELTGAALDWAVAKRAGEYLAGYAVDWRNNRANKYSANWAKGGPIIERERISLVGVGIVNWKASINKADMYTATQYGDTPLIAAMRCYVASKLGDTVAVPKDLIYD